MAGVDDVVEVDMILQDGGRRGRGRQRARIELAELVDDGVLESHGTGVAGAAAASRAAEEATPSDSEITEKITTVYAVPETITHKILHNHDILHFVLSTITE